MSTVTVVAWLVVAAGCGRFGFDTTGRGLTGRDAAEDSAADTASAARCSGPAPTCRLVFTTSQTYTGALGGLTGADAICQQLAMAASLPGTYMAWLSDSAGTPITRFVHATVPYMLVDGTVIANDWTQLTSGTILHAISESETGGPPGHDDSGNGCNLPAAATLVWTSTKFDGSDVPATDCTSWTSSAFSTPSEWGRDDLTTGQWSAFCSSGSCSWHAPLFCFQQ